nr:hypothetical protein [Tanacetum cinerariifolium]
NLRDCPAGIWTRPHGEVGLGARVTYTSISSDYKHPSGVSSPGVIVYGYDGLPTHTVDPSSPDYVHGPEEPEQASLSPDYVSGPEYPKYLALFDEEVPVEDQPYAADDSPIALSLGYIDDLDPNDESVDGRGRGGALAPADSIVVVSLIVDPVPSAEETKPFETDESEMTPPPPPLAYRTTARFEVRESSTADAARHPSLRDARTTDYGFVDMVDDAPRFHVPREVEYGITDT